MEPTQVSPSAQLIFSHAPFKERSCKVSFLSAGCFFFSLSELGLSFIPLAFSFFFFFTQLLFQSDPQNVLLHVSGLVSISAAALNTPLSLSASQLQNSSTGRNVFASVGLTLYFILFFTVKHYIVISAPPFLLKVFYWQSNTLHLVLPVTTFVAGTGRNLYSVWAWCGH